MRCALMAAVVSAGICFAAGAFAQDVALPPIDDVAAQPLKAQAQRLAQALEFLGEPLSAEQKERLAAAIATADEAAAVQAIQALFDPLCLAAVNINPESRVKVARGPVAPQLVEQGWRVFLVKVHNEAGVTAPLVVTSPQASPIHRRSTGSPEPPPGVTPAEAADRWLDLSTFDQQPLNRTLSGLEVEYRIVQLYSRDRGKREATLGFHIGQGTQDLGFRSELAVLFEAAPAVKVNLAVLDHDGQPTTGWFIFRDSQGRVYPARSRRLSPDFFFHDQVYRTDGEHVLLPPGKYSVEFGRGPEHRIQRSTLDVPAAAAHQAAFRHQRWIHLAEHGWWSGDHHVHAAGCSHYDAPTEGVTPEAMMRHIVGEDLNVGCVLSWGPCWYHQKQFFEGRVHKLSTDRHLMRYDVEVSGFPSQHCGHLCLLRLTDDNYPGTTRIDQWPSWDLPILKWGKSQGAVVGFSHSGWGLAVPGDELPNYNLPPYDGIGANEYIVDVTHDAVDFISAVDTPSVWELNIWYHTLNCGYTARISGETDFPCIYGERVGLGRSYVQLPPGAPLDYDAWVYGLRDGRSYVSDGLGHLFDFAAGSLAVGYPGAGDRPSVLAARAGDEVTLTVRAAALLEDEPQEQIRRRPLDQKPYWHVERARIGQSRRVPVELIVNGQPVQRREIVADGAVHDLRFQWKPERSSWVAVRIFPSAHTNPIFVEVDEAPIRASRRSAEWCLASVDKCWEQKQGRIRPAERPAAAAAYQHAREAYQKIVAESFDDRR